MKIRSVLSISSLYHRIVNISPNIEVFMRHLYWRNVYLLKKHKISKHIDRPYSNIDFNNICKCLKDNGVKDNDILVIHSAYSPFKKQFKGEEIISMLIDVVPNGTIAMPAIRHYPEDEPYEQYINISYEGKCSIYDVNNSKITSGYLPYLMTKDQRAHISRCPHNPLVAIGKDAEPMMAGNIDMEFITAHGTGSCWDYCVKKDAWSIGLGIPIEGFLTIFHNTQECGDWPIKNWFFPRKFKVIDGDFQKEIIFNERFHASTMYYAESNFNKDMIAAGVIKEFVVDGIPILMTKTSRLYEFLADKMKSNPSYPYYFPKKYYK